VLGTVKIPRRDGTPPQAALDVVGLGRTWVLAKGDDPVQIELEDGDSLVLIGLGEDRDGGVRDFSLAGNAVAVCGTDTGDRQKSDSFLRRTVIPGLRPGIRVGGSKSTRVIVRVEDFRRLCDGGDLKALNGAAGVRTVNFHGAAAQSPSLRFRFTAPEAAEQGPATPASGMLRPQKAQTVVAKRVP